MFLLLSTYSVGKNGCFNLLVERDSSIGIRGVF